ncbi:MAG: DUF3048 domain-containing protein, partial [Chloroflexota bacterium]
MLKRIVTIMVLVLVFSACDQVAPTPVISLPTETEAATAIHSPVKATADAPSATSTAPVAAPTDQAGTPTVPPTLAPVAYGPENFPADVDPLTGLTVADASILNRRPLGIKVNVYPRWTRPPWGISLADIVFDYYHNDGSTRYHAIFYGQDAELVGPIRSGRLLDDSLVRMYKSIFAYGSADVQINDRLLNAEYANRLVLEGTRSLCPPTDKLPLCRYEPNGSDFMLTGTKELSAYGTAKGIDNSRQNLNGMSFNSTAPAGGKEGEQAYVFISIDVYNRWDYDAATGRYKLFGDNLYL